MLVSYIGKFWIVCGFIGLYRCPIFALTNYNNKYLNFMKKYIVKYTVSSDNINHYCTLQAGDKAEIRNSTFKRFAQVNNLKGYKIIYIVAAGPTLTYAS